MLFGYFWVDVNEGMGKQDRILRDKIYLHLNKTHRQTDKQTKQFNISTTKATSKGSFIS